MTAVFILQITTAEPGGCRLTGRIGPRLAGDTREIFSQKIIPYPASDTRLATRYFFPPKNFNASLILSSELVAAALTALIASRAWACE